MSETVFFAGVIEAESPQDGDLGVRRRMRRTQAKGGGDGARVSNHEPSEDFAESVPHCVAVRFFCSGKYGPPHPGDRELCLCVEMRCGGSGPLI